MCHEKALPVRASNALSDEREFWDSIAILPPLLQLPKLHPHFRLGLDGLAELDGGARRGVSSEMMPRAVVERNS